jgi:HD-GYP domain-containing protein (c-di-GMP phosphodiesterase class II)
MMSFCLESQMGLTVHQALTFQEAMDLFLDETPMDLVVTSQQPETDKLFRYLLSTTANIPVILIRESTQEKIEVFPDIRVLAQVLRSDIPDKLITVIRENFNEILNTTLSDEYCRIKTDLLMRVVPLRGDIFIRLSSVKFVKMFRRGMIFTSEDLERFVVKKKVNYLYIKKASCQEFVEKFKEDLLLIIALATPGDEQMLNTVVEVQELIQELSGRLGFTKDVQDLVHSNINLAIKAIGLSPKLTKVLASSQLKQRNFISSHSVMLANIACSIAALMQWPSNTTFQKLVMAALFHDFFFQDPELAKISTKKELDDLKLKPTDEKYLEIKNHPIKCSELIKTLHEIPGDVDVVVLQHHERADGTGFPKGLRAHQIAPLSAVLIIAHDILDKLNKEGDKFDLKMFLKRSEPDYQGNVFRKVWKALISQDSTKEPADGNGSNAA